LGLIGRLTMAIGTVVGRRNGGTREDLGKITQRGVDRRYEKVIEFDLR